MFKKAEKNSMFGSVMNRLSFRSRRIKDMTIDTKSIPKNVTTNSLERKTLDIEKECCLHESISKEQNVEKKNIDVIGNESLLVNSLGDCIIPTPSSSTYRQSRPLSELDTALKSFQIGAVKSRKSLSISKDITQSATQPRSASSLTLNYPSTPSSCWRQKPPPANNHLDHEWKKLSSSILSINHDRRDQLWKETDLAKTDVSIRSSNKSLDTASLAVVREDVEEVRVTRAQSMNVLDMPCEEKIFQIPSNQLMQMNQYQRRVQASMEKLSVPSWYNPSATPSPCTTATYTPRWRQPGGSTSSSSSTGWRRYVSHSSSPSTSTSTPERNSTPLSSQRYRSRIITLPSSTRSPSTSSINSSISTFSKPIYLGWRSQEKLNTGPAYLTSPAQRLASSAIRLVSRPASATTGTATVGTAHDGIKEITEAILEFCNSSLLGDKPTQFKEAWPCIDADSDINDDDMDDDSGIDTQENINA